MTTEDAFEDWVPLAALDALDAQGWTAFETHRRNCPACDRALWHDRAIAHRLTLALAPVIPSPGLKRRVLEAVAAEAPRGVRALAVPTRRAVRWPTILAALPAAAALLLGFAFVGARQERDEARRSAETSRGVAEAVQAELVDVRQRLERATSFRELVAQPDSRVTSLTGAAQGSRGRMVWSPSIRSAVLLVSGLPSAPEGKTYQLWVIARGAPVPAGLFQVDVEGHALFTLPALEENAPVKTFAVTLEPAGGRPAPSGPMVLAGTVS